MLKRTLVGAVLALTSCLAVADSKPAPQIENIKDIRVDGKSTPPSSTSMLFARRLTLIVMTTVGGRGGKRSGLCQSQ